MTTNQLELRKIKESERHNKATESIDISKLNETIRNNDLINKVNISKNQIQKLANEQLNDRELAKLDEQMNLAYDQLEETAYSNDLKEYIQRLQNTANKEINAAHDSASKTAALYSAIGGIARGSLGAAINSMSTGNSGTVFALSSTATHKLQNDPNLVYRIISGTMTDYDIQLLFGSDSRYFKDNSGGSMSPSQVQDKIESYADLEQGLVDNFGPNRQRRQSNRVQRQAQPQYDSPYMAERPTRGQKYTRKVSDIFSEDKEIGPGTNTTNTDRYQNLSVLNANELPTSGVQYSRHGTTSGGTDYHISGGIQSSATIVQPSANGNNKYL